MREIKVMSTDILTSNKQIELSGFSPPIVLPLYETTNQRLPSATGITAPASVVCISTATQGVRLLEPHSVSAATFKVGEQLVPLRELLLESSDARVPSTVDGHRAVVEGGFVLPVANETDDLIEFKSTTRFLVSTIGDEDDDEWSETGAAEYDAAHPLLGFASPPKMAKRRQPATRTPP